MSNHATGGLETCSSLLCSYVPRETLVNINVKDKIMSFDVQCANVLIIPSFFYELLKLAFQA